MILSGAHQATLERVCNFADHALKIIGRSWSFRDEKVREGTWILRSNHCSPLHPPLNATHHAVCRQRAARGHDTSQSRRIRGEKGARREGSPRGWAGGEKENGREVRNAKGEEHEEGEDPARASGRNLGPRVPKHGLVSLLGLHGQRSSSSTSHLRVLNLLPRQSWRRRYKPHY